VWITVAVAKAGSEISFVVQGQRKRFRALVVNAAVAVLSPFGAYVVYSALHGPEHLWSSNFGPLLALPALVAAGAVHHTIGTLIVVGAITLNSKESLRSIFGQIYTEALLPELSLIAVGIVLAIMWHFSPALSFFIIVPVYLSVRSFASVAQLRRETVEAVLKMAESIDYRDTGTYEHSQRLADLTKRLSRALGLLGEDVNQVVLAARVHDLGKIGISNDILLKQGPLTPDERQIMQDHPVIGATILASYSAFQDSVPIVRHHHEHWDGRGYPDGLKGEEIPIGSRIISVVDAFDSMIADRPYRKGMSVEVAVDRLKAGMGTQFDPRVCAAFVQLLIEEGVYVPREAAPDLQIVTREAS
jgi:putative nucleotidyltransferase with HDIG domain